MGKLILILFVALTFETIGVISLKKGLVALETPKSYSPREILSFARQGITNRYLVLGVFFEAIFFAGLLMMMKMGEVSFVWPLTSLTFVFSTIAAKFFLQEEVSFIRWIGVVLIMCGAGFITYSEKAREREMRAAPPQTLEQSGI